LEALKKDGLKVVIYSDSKYVVDSVEKRMVEYMDSYRFQRWQKIKIYGRFYHLAKKAVSAFCLGKRTCRQSDNNRCDQLATEAADSGILIEDKV
jgi:ribonuclease HI